MASALLGTWQAFMLSLLGVIVWLIAGLYYGYTNELYQLSINSSTTVFTFLMVFLIQNTQNRSTAAIQLKLDELIRANENARNQMMRLEDLSENQIKRVKESFTDPGCDQLPH